MIRGGGVFWIALYSSLFLVIKSIFLALPSPQQAWESETVIFEKSVAPTAAVAGDVPIAKAAVNGSPGVAPFSACLMWKDDNQVSDFCRGVGVLKSIAAYERTDVLHVRPFDIIDSFTPNLLYLLVSCRMVGLSLHSITAPTADYRHRPLCNDIARTHSQGVQPVHQHDALD